MTAIDVLPTVGQGATRPITVTLTEGTLAAVRQMAGPRGTSSFMEQALQRELRRLALRTLVEDYEAENGAIPPAEVERQRARLRQVREGGQ